MVSPAWLPRTLKGLGGIRLINVPGVKFPDTAFRADKGMNPQTGKPFDYPLHDTISTHEAARILGRSINSAHMLLRKKDIPFCLVRHNGSGRTVFYWDREAVKQLLRGLPPVQKHLPATLVKAADALLILGIVRSTLYRYVASGKLSEIRRRVMTTRGYRHQCLYLKSEVMKLKSWRNACRKQAISWRSFRKEQREEVGEPEQVES